jgi:hypothetical protein
MPRPLVVRSMFHRPAALVLLLCAVTVSIALGQAGVAYDANSTAQIPSNPVPLHHVYWHFLRYQRHLDQRAATLEQQGRPKEAQELRRHLQKELHLSNAQAAILRQAGEQMEKDSNAIWAKAMPIMIQDREWVRLNGRSSGPPPGHAQVHALQEEREGVIRDAVAELNRKLGPKAAARLQARIEKEWAPRVTVQNIASQRTHDPRIDSKLSAPYHLERQP